MSTLSQVISTYFNIGDGWAMDGWIPVCCPLHNDGNPSASINFKFKTFKCFAGCDTISFVKLAKKLSLVWDENISDTVAIDSEDWLNNLSIFETQVPKRTIKQQAKEYTDFLLSRKLKPETIEEFNGEYISDLTHQDYGHLVIPYGKGKYVKRRIIRGNGHRFKQSENNGSGDSKSLFGKAEYWKHSVLLCEGITDYFTLWQNGILEGCASFGASTSDSQMYLLREKTVFILFDKDFSGYTGSRKAAEQL